MAGSLVCEARTFRRIARRRKRRGTGAGLSFGDGGRDCRDTGPLGLVDDEIPEEPLENTSNRMLRRGLLATLALAAAQLSLPLPAAAQADPAADYPSRAIKFLVPFPPGSGTDTSARYFARKITEITGQPVVVENRPGGNGFIAVQQALSAPADGYTVFIGSNSTLATNAALFKKLPYDPVADFAPISVLMRAPALVIVPPNSPYKSVADVVEAAKKAPGKINYASGSAAYQLMSELFNETARVETNHVPFKGAGDAITAIASGNADIAFVDITGSIELAKSGRVRAIAIADERRSPDLPDVPTAIEAGLPGYLAFTWVAAMINAKTPKPIVDKLSTLFVQIASAPDTRDYYAKLNASVMAGGPEATRRFQLGEIDLWKRIAAKAKVEQQ